MSATARVGLQQEVEVKRVCQLYGRGTRALYFSMAVATICAMVLWSSLPRAWIGSWLTLQIIVSLSRLSLIARFHQQARPAAFSVHYWEKIYGAGCLLGGLTWGSLAIFLPWLVPDMQSGIVIIIAGVGAGSVITGLPSPLCSVLFLAPTTLPLSLVLLLMPSRDHTILSLLIILFLLMLLGFSRTLRNTLLSSLRLAEDKAMLATNLQKTSQELARQRDEFSRLSLTDPLTGLDNRRALIARLEQALARAKRYQQILVLGILDLDDFKPINDRYGHSVGDACLKEIAKRLQHVMRSTDSTARLGGDEFVILLEGLNHTEALSTALERMRKSIEAPMEIDGISLRIKASLGLAIYPQHESDPSPDTLLRAADHALYAVKAKKHDRSRWWMLPQDEKTADAQRVAIEQSNPPGIFFAAYGETAKTQLLPYQDIFRSIAKTFAEAFYARLAFEAGSSPLLAAFSLPELEELKTQQSLHLGLLVDPELNEVSHRKFAHKLGKIHAAVGIDRTELMQSYQYWMETLQHAFTRDLRPLQPILDRRIVVEIEEELAGYAEIDRQREVALAKIAEFAWQAECYCDLIEGTVQSLQALDEVLAATIARPDPEGSILFEAVAGAPFLQYLQQVENGRAPPIRTNRSTPEGQGPSSDAWASGEIQHVTNYQTSKRLAPWRKIVMALGFHSQAVVPIRIHGENKILLQLFSQYRGGFTSPAQKAFLQHLQQILALGYGRLHESTTAPMVQSAIQRQRYKSLLTSGGLEMLFQPIVDLSTGEIDKVEALARLRDDTTLITPDLFLPTLNRDELLALYRLGLEQALYHIATWHTEGLRIDISLNLPAHALTDPRYRDVTRAALQQQALPEGRTLTLEVLETGTVNELGALQVTLDAWRALGVQLAQDDLGEAYSSLSRLRHIPFEMVKIDQNLVRGASVNPLRVLSFIARLSDLAQEAGARTVVEGLETHGLIEAAAILGAEFGQGYGIARPLAARDLRAWVQRHLPLQLDPSHPHTALGTLAASLRWEYRLAAVNATWPELIRQIAGLPCAASAWLHEYKLENTPIGQLHQSMQAAAIRAGNINDPQYRRLRDSYLELLVNRAVTEEGGTPSRQAATAKKH